MNTSIKERSIKRYRQFAGYTQKSLANALSMPLSTYQQKERGKISFSDSDKLRIKKLFSDRVGKLTIDDIFFS